MPACKNHPERQGRRKCYLCEAPICPTCQKHIDRHIFCSRACARICKANDRRDWLAKRWLSIRMGLDPRIWWRYPPFVRAGFAKRTMFMIWLLLAITLLQSVLLWEKSQPQPERQGMWLQRPEIHEGWVRYRVFGGADGIRVLRDGRVLAEVLPGTILDRTSVAPIKPTVWTLQSLAEKNLESWTAPVERVVVHRGRRPGIALSFDGGAEDNMLKPLLATLQRRQVRATFFLTGQFMERFPEETRRITRMGHEIGNHSWSHPHTTSWEENQRHHTSVDRQTFEWQLLRTEQLFERLTGEQMAPLYRPPFGEVNPELSAWAASLGYSTIMWSSTGERLRTLDTLDWVVRRSDPLYVSGKDMARRVVSLAGEADFRGGIVLMHVGSQRSTNRIQDELDYLIVQLRKRGLALLPVSELLPSGND